MQIDGFHHKTKCLDNKVTHPSHTDNKNNNVEQCLFPQMDSDKDFSSLMCEAFMFIFCARISSS